MAASGDTLTSYCSFVSDFIAGHPECGQLLDVERPGRAVTEVAMTWP